MSKVWSCGRRERDDADVVVVFGAGRGVGATCGWKCCAAKCALTRTDAQSLAGSDEHTPTPPQRHVDAEAAQSSTNGAREAGASAKLGPEAHEHGAATVVTENDRLCAMKIGPATQVGRLVFAQHGERAAEGFGSLHVRFFTGDMMSKWHDVWRLPSDSMSNAHAAD
jgi:hypothetical protein